MIPRHLMIGVTVMLAVALGMGLYVWRMRGGVRQSETPPAYTHPVAAPVQGPTEQVTLYVAYDDPGGCGLRRQTFLCRRDARSGRRSCFEPC